MQTKRKIHSTQNWKLRLSHKLRRVKRIKKIKGKESENVCVCVCMCVSVCVCERERMIIMHPIVCLENPSPSET
jgi:hypothetical protein